MRFVHRFLLGGALALFAGGAMGQTTTVSGSIRAIVQGGGSVDIILECTGEPTCNGNYQSFQQNPGCSNTFSLGGRVSVEDMDLSRAQALDLRVTFGGFTANDEMHPNGTCSIRPGSIRDEVFQFRATWDGRSLIQISETVVGTDGVPALFTGTLSVDRASAPPVFPMDVQATFDTTARVSATFEVRTQDAGIVGSVYVFALAPATVVKSSGEKAAGFGHIAKGDTDTPVQCVLAQLSSSGQLTGVTASSMQPYITGVLSGQRQAVTLVDGVPAVNIAGATFYLGYDSGTGQAMLDNGLNRSAATAPGAVQCKPEAPETGWWWNAAEGGRGYSVEVRGNRIFFAAFHYDVSGRSTWHVATSEGLSLDGSVYSNKPLYAASGGQTLAGGYRGKPAVTEIGKITLAFADKRTGTMVWPGGVVPIERFNIVANGINAAPKSNQPETGWWWNEQEDGRGFFMEWQNGTIDLAGYMYDDQGNPVWYLGVYPTPDIRAMNGNWWSYANGQSMGGAYKPATRVNDNVAPVSITFSGPDAALMTLPGGRTTQLRRHRF